MVIRQNVLLQPKIELNFICHRFFTDNLKLQQLKKFLKENRKKLKKKYLKELNQKQLG